MLRSGGFFRRDRSQPRRGVGDQVSAGLPEGLLFSGSLNDDRERSEVQGLPKFGIIGVTVDDPASFSKVVLYLCQVRVQAHRSFVPLAEGCVSRRADATGGPR